MLAAPLRPKAPRHTDLHKMFTKPIEKGAEPFSGLKTTVLLPKPPSETQIVIRHLGKRPPMYYSNALFSGIR